MSEPNICEEGGRGIFLPLFGESEHRLPNGLRTIIYLVAMLWMFMGVSIIADVFMGAIETVTSKTRVKIDEWGQKVHVKVWNATVANLTLMALGSSAPEILLSIIEILGNDFYSGDLGPSTIVGSAAFNLLVIIAVCIISIPDGEMRRVKELNVFLVTSSFSMFAYLWLAFILIIWSKDAITIIEGALTFLFFPVMVLIAYWADIGYLCFAKGAKTDIESESVKNRGRISYRRDAIRWMVAGKKLEMDTDSEATQVKLQFNSELYEVQHGEPGVCIYVERIGPVAFEVSARYQVEGIPSEVGECRLKADQTHAAIVLKGWDNTVQGFNVRLSDPKVESMPCGANVPQICIGRTEVTKVQLVEHEGPGILMFLDTEMVVPAPQVTTVLHVVVVRDGGTRGQVQCKYRTEKGTAVPEYDYEECSGDLVFHNGQARACIALRIMAKDRYEHKDHFSLVLEDIEGGASFNEQDDGGSEKNMATITILAQEGGEGLMRQCDGFCNFDQLALGCQEWRDQFTEAIYVNGSFEEQRDASCSDWMLHVVAFFWKVLFAFNPPTAFCGGWVCFFCAVAFIGVMTAAIGDVAALFGCCAGLPDPITAITCVALGTSLPDTFASKTAACQDATADNAIGNVTGSNAVNVFLGLGLPWLMGSIYWEVNGPTDKWESKYESLKDTYKGGAFIVQSGDLGFSVTAYILTCCLCLMTLVARRRFLGAELGGPRVLKLTSSVFLVILWVYYISVSSWKVVVGEASSLNQALVLVLGIVAAVAISSVVGLIFKLVCKEDEVLKDDSGIIQISVPEHRYETE